jgi:O-antigen/teichoic acid export membrane protein
MGQLISAAAAFLLSIAFANLLPKETFGIYRYILSIAGILAIPTLSGMNTAVIQAVARGYEGVALSALKTKIRWGLLGGLASLILSGYYYFNNNPTLTICFLVAAVFLPFMDSFNLYGALLVGKKLFVISTKYRVITQIISVSILIATLFLTKNVFFILLAYFISYTFLRFIFLKITLKKISFNQKEDPKTLPYGKYLSLLDVISTIANYLDRILVFHYLGAIELAIYSFAIIPSEQIKGFLKVVHSLALPKFAQRGKEEIKKTVFKKMVKFSFFIAIIVILYIILAPFLYKIIFPQYMDSVFYSQIFSISLITAIATLPTAALQAKMAKKQLYQLNIYSSLIQIAMLFLFIYFYGLLGVILARIIYRFINTVLLCFLIKKI